MKELSSERGELLKDNAQIRDRAVLVRNMFVSEIGPLLRESRAVVKLKTKIKSLEDKIAELSILESELESTKHKLKVVEKSYYLSQSPKVQSKGSNLPLPTLDDDLLLAVFSFLMTEDVISVSQVIN